MFKKDFEGKAEWWRDVKSARLPNVVFYLRIETEDMWTWYRLDIETNNLIELDETRSQALEERRDEGT